MFEGDKLVARVSSLGFRAEDIRKALTYLSDHDAGHMSIPHSMIDNGHHYCLSELLLIFDSKGKTQLLSEVLGNVMDPDNDR